MCRIATLPVCYWNTGNTHTLLSRHSTTQGPIMLHIRLLFQSLERLKFELLLKSDSEACWERSSVFWVEWMYISAVQGARPAGQDLPDMAAASVSVICADAQSLGSSGQAAPGDTLQLQEWILRLGRHHETARKGRAWEIHSSFLVCGLSLLPALCLLSAVRRYQQAWVCAVEGEGFGVWEAGGRLPNHQSNLDLIETLQSGKLMSVNASSITRMMATRFGFWLDRKGTKWLWGVTGETSSPARTSHLASKPMTRVCCRNRMGNTSRWNTDF